MAKHYFGTDGVRGIANVDLTPELALNLGRSTATAVNSQLKGGSKTILIGRDTRISGNMLESALSAGFLSMGWNVISVGIVPTPCVSYLVRTEGFQLGAVISASHNPAPDNGIKFFGDDGRKLNDDIEANIEERMLDSNSTLNPLSKDQISGRQVGTLTHRIDLVDKYVQFLIQNGESLDGMTVAIDAANGAAFEIGIRALEGLGAKVTAIGIEPDGMNINSVGGATKPQVIQKFTVDSDADFGIAFDGDADRAVFSDRKGRLLNGDRTMGIWAIQKMKDGLLNPKTIVGTVMSNGGFETYLNNQGIELSRAPVGDKYVAERIEQLDAKIGGEQSGHIIFPEFGPTGDGIMTAIQLLKAMKLAEKDATEFYDEFEPWPQVLINFRIERPKEWNRFEEIQAAFDNAEIALGSTGRINLRPSGTQPVLRLMVEAKEKGLRDEIASKIKSALIEYGSAHVESEVDLTYALGD